VDALEAELEGRPAPSRAEALSAARIVSKPAFSVVVPAFNAEETLAETIGSVLAQTESDFELLIVDDGSTDGTLELAHSLATDPRVRVIHQQNKGLAGARNAGIAAASGRYVAFLDSDDLWMPEFLRATGAALDGDPGAGFAYTDGWALDDERGRLRRATVMARQRPPVPPPHDATEFLAQLIQRNFVLAEATVRMSALAEVGPFVESLRAVEDYELWLRLLAHGYRAARPPGLLLIRRDHQASMSKDIVLMYKATREVMRMVVDSHPAPESVKAIARRRIAELDRLIAADTGTGATRPWPVRIRGVVGALKRRLLGDRLFLAEPPPEVASAFPNLLARDQAPASSSATSTSRSA
jgi:glycosyltransferase involved in cell wall biosynthesis